MRQVGRRIQRAAAPFHAAGRRRAVLGFPRANGESRCQVDRDGWLSSETFVGQDASRSNIRLKARSGRLRSVRRRTGKAPEQTFGWSFASQIVHLWAGATLSTAVFGPRLSRQSRAANFLSPHIPPSAPSTNLAARNSPISGSKWAAYCRHLPTPRAFTGSRTCMRLTVRTVR